MDIPGTPTEADLLEVASSAAVIEAATQLLEEGISGQVATVEDQNFQLFEDHT